MAICKRCHKEFEGNTTNCPSCLDKRRTNRLILKHKRELKGSCNRCGKPIENPIFKTCDACRCKQSTIQTRYRKNHKVITIVAIIKCLKKAAYGNKLAPEIYNDFQINLELLGIRYSQENWR
ncbi:MAG: hypothetical protein WCR54_07060 [Clostridia bacterium]